MATAARGRLARTLRGDAKTAFSVELTARADDLLLDVEGLGAVKFPATPAKTRKLLGLGRSARFGRSEETLTEARDHADLEWLAENARTPKFDQSGFEDR